MCKFRATQQTKWKLIRARQEQVKSYKEVCAPVLERCRSAYLTQILFKTMFIYPWSFEKNNLLEYRRIFDVLKRVKIVWTVLAFRPNRIFKNFRFFGGFILTRICILYKFFLTMLSLTEILIMNVAKPIVH